PRVLRAGVAVERRRAAPAAFQRRGAVVLRRVEEHLAAGRAAGGDDRRLAALHVHGGGQRGLRVHLCAEQQFLVAVRVAPVPLVRLPGPYGDQRRHRLPGERGRLVVGERRAGAEPRRRRGVQAGADGEDGVRYRVVQALQRTAPGGPAAAEGGQGPGQHGGG